MVLTGNIRHRLQNRLFGKPMLVLEAEYEYNMGNHIECETYLRWRDATVQDLQILGKIKAGIQ